MSLKSTLRKRNEILAVVGPFIPHTVAIRLRNKRCEWHKAKYVPTTTRQTVIVKDFDTIVSAGRRELLRHAISNAVRRGSITRTPDGRYELSRNELITPAP